MAAWTSPVSLTQDILVLRRTLVRFPAVQGTSLGIFWVAANSRDPAGVDMGAGHVDPDPVLTPTVGELGGSSALCPYSAPRKGDHGAATLQHVTEQ